MINLRTLKRNATREAALRGISKYLKRILKNKNDIISVGQKRKDELNAWLKWQDIQINKFLRAAATGKAIGVSDGRKTYRSLEELFAEADRKQRILSRLENKK